MAVPNYATKTLTVSVTPELENVVDQISRRLLVGPRQISAVALAVGLRLLDQTVAARELESLPGLVVDVLVNERQ